MNIQELKESFDYLAKAALTPFIWGHQGVGKTEATRQWAKERGYKFFPFYLGTMSDTGDILGLAEFTKRAKGGKSTDFAPPGWLLDMIDYCTENPESGAVIFLDEFNRARRDILQGIFSLALDKTFHTVKLPDNCHIIAAGNPPTDEYNTTDVDETALMARFVHIKLEPTVQEWITYARNAEVEPTLVGFIQDQPQLLEEKYTEFKLPVKPGRRAYIRLDKLMKTGVPNNLMDQLMPGIIGLERTVAYKQYLKQMDKPLTGEEVLEHKRPDLIEKWSNHENVQASFLNVTCENVKILLADRDKAGKNLSAAEKSNFMWFMNTVPKDISYTLIDTVVKTQNKVFKDFFDDAIYRKPVAELYMAAKGQVLKEEKK